MSESDLERDIRRMIDGVSKPSERPPLPLISRESAGLMIQHAGDQPEVRGDALVSATNGESIALVDQVEL